MIPVSKTIEADVVIVGGGIGGPMAAIAAAEAGAKRVVVLEKCEREAFRIRCYGQ